MDIVHSADTWEPPRENFHEYWVFSSHINYDPTPALSTVSIILDAGASNTIDELRLLILSHADEVIGNLRDIETTQPKLYGEAAERNNQHAACRRITLPLIFHPSHLHRPPSIYGSWRPSTKPKIIYDTVFSLSRGHPFFISLRDDSIYGNQSSYLPHHSVYRILPTNALHRRPFPMLPANLLRAIVRDSIDDPHDHSHSKQKARRTIALALLSKAWLVALDIIWERPFDKEGRFPSISFGMFSKITKSVERNPEYARRWLCFPQVEDWFRSSDDRERTQAVARIFMEHATHLKFIRVSPQLYAGNQESLRLLRKVEEFHMWNFGDDRRWGHRLSLSDIMQTMLGWDALQTLWVLGWSDSGQLDQPQYAKYQLQHLTLSQGPLSGAHLRGLLSNSSRTLRVLRLRGVTGLTNQDIYGILLSVSENLEEVALTNFKIPPLAIEGEERAFDASVERMVRLRKATLHTSMASNLAIMRKRSSQMVPHSELSLTPYTVDCIRPETDPAGVGIIAAVQHTAWSKVELSILSPSSTDDEAELGQELRRAMEKSFLDIKFESER